MDDDINQCCGTCNYCILLGGELCCTNEDSKGYALIIAYDDCCDEYEKYQ
jgi:hypothetical protein